MLGLYIKGDPISKARAGFSVIDTTFDDGYGATLDLLVDASQMPSGGQQTFDQSTNSSFIKPVAWRPLQHS
mgnify:FL=1|jgi:hypothetical protein|tara:strand:- start:319 stop:531 length:213 start_codon:yes stop_codon:yes gene_type:complete